MTSDFETHPHLGSAKINNITDDILSKILNDLELYALDFNQKPQQVIYIHQINADEATLYLRKPIPIQIAKTENGIRLEQPDTQLHYECCNLKTVLKRFQNEFYARYQDALKQKGHMHSFYLDVVGGCVSS